MTQLLQGVGPAISLAGSFGRAGKAGAPGGTCMLAHCLSGAWELQFGTQLDDTGAWARLYWELQVPDARLNTQKRVRTANVCPQTLP
mmetsp:Transcript_2457/g.4127  ORF Transcript_2457/g.4127 Transcript_2457/m.4127 type:complete len:87 (-) Transcript_2457:18-278(-)